MPAPGAKIEAMVERIAVDQFRREGGAFVLGVTGLPADAAPLLALRRCRLGRLETMSEDGGLDEVEESFLAAASCSWRRATVPSSAFNRACWASNFACWASNFACWTSNFASWASNFACKRRQFGQDFRALGLMTGYATHIVGNTQHR